MPVVTNTLHRPDGSPAAGALVTVRLIASLEGSGPGYVAGDQASVLDRWVTRADAAGSWAVDLVPNGDVTPDGTVYEVVEAVPGRPALPQHVAVPADAGPHWVGDILTDPPATLPSSALGAHQLATTGAHGLPDPATIVTEAQADARYRQLGVALGRADLHFDPRVSLDRWDDFDRPNSPLTASATMPSGQAWTIGTTEVGNASLVIRDRALFFDVAGASYVRVGGADYSRFMARFSFGPGAGIGAALGVISSKRPVTNPSTGPTGIATNSVHAVFGADTWSVGIFDGVGNRLFASSALDPTFDYPPLDVDQVYRAGLERLDAGRVRIHLPNGRSIDKTDADIAARTGLPLKLKDWWGQTALIEHFQPAASFAGDRRLAIHEATISGTGHTAADSHAPTDAWHVVGAAGEPAFNPPWRPFVGFQVPRFRKVGNQVFLDGVLGHDGAVNASIAFVLPAGYRPAATIIPYGFGRFDVDAAGNVICRNVGAGTFHSLTCSFWVD
ncbi:MAG TPA: hypothetical protein VGR26_15095 [Acidimicrobiales bacterium]|nr:hypothetical protein [Acidimicrobiales bacterium]